MRLTEPKLLPPLPSSQAISGGCWGTHSHLRKHTAEDLERHHRRHSRALDRQMVATLSQRHIRTYVLLNFIGFLRLLTAAACPYTYRCQDMNP